MPLLRRFKISPVLLLFNIVLICLAIINQKFEAPFLYYWILSLIIFEVIDIAFAALAAYGAKNILVVREVSDHAVEGDTITVELVLKNLSALPLYNICLEDSLGQMSKDGFKRSFLPSLGKKDSLRIAYDIHCHKRAKYLLGPIMIHFFDPLGMFSFKRSYPVYSTVYVCPRTVDLKGFVPLTKGNLPWFGVETRRVSGDEDEFFGIREYRQGDPIKRIHWFSTARKNQLIVKEFQSFSFYKAILLFVLNEDENAGQGKESVSEYIVKIASSLSKYLLENNISLEILGHAGKMFHLGPNRGIQYFDETMRLFASVKPESRITLGELSQHLSPQLSSDSTLIIISSEKSFEDLSGFLHLSRYNVSLVPIVVLSFSFRDDVFGQEKSMYMERAYSSGLGKAGAPAFFVSKGDNLEDIFVV